MAMIEAKTKLGTYRGIQDNHPDYTVFKGIPYAKSPVGQLRWKKPQPVESFKGTFIADTFSPISVQERHAIGSFYQKEFFEHQEAMSEDSLYLNIWTPANASTDKLPVLLWIHGGAFTGGYGHEIEFDGELFSKRGVILVTVNYRLGVLGFLSHPWLQAEGEHGNFGVYDQMEAIRFIHEHIEAFGGDKENITIMGQSAGSLAAQIICSTEQTKGLFSKAILQSGAGTNSLLQAIPQEAQANQMAEIIKNLGYTSLEELRNTPYKVLVHDIHQYIQTHQLNALTLLAPNIDGKLFAANLDTLLETGQFHDIPYIIGSTKNELFSPETAKLIAMSSYGFASKQLQWHTNPVYVYLFNHDLPGDEAGAFHSGELWYEFGTLKKCWRPFTLEDYDLSAKMNLYWSEFIKKADPNNQDLPEWPKWNDEERQVLVLDCPIKTKQV